MNLKSIAYETLERISQRTETRTDREQSCVQSVHGVSEKKAPREHYFSKEILTNGRVKGGAVHEAFNVNKSVNTTENAATLTQDKKNQLKHKAWSQEDETLIKWFLESIQLPASPFQLKPGIKVTVSQKFYDSLKENIKEGPSGPRTLFKALQDDLKCLKKISEKTL